MADSKHAQEVFNAVKESSAYRVKYRILNNDNSIKITKKAIFKQGVHTGNRGGIHPSGDRCKSLVQKILCPSGGWDQSEVEYGGCVVQEVPFAERPPGYVTYTKFALKESAGSELLFPVSDNVEFEYGSLAHGHIALVLKGCLKGARFYVDGISVETGENVGCVDVEKWKAKYPEMYQAALEGLPSEELSWRMNIEEPRAAVVISRVLNNKNRVQLLPTEMEVIATLSLQIDLAVGESVARDVSFFTLKEDLRKMLDCLVDDPDFIKVFKFVLELGSADEEFIPYLKSWYGTYVDASIRRLKLDAFKMLSDLNIEEPWLKIACVIWCYRSKPHPETSYCPNIYSGMLTLNDDARESLNRMLNFWHGPVKKQMKDDGMTDASMLQWLSNADYECINAVVAGLQKRPAQCKDAASVEAAVGLALKPVWDGLGLKLGQLSGLPDGQMQELPQPPYPFIAGPSGQGAPPPSAAPARAAAAEEIRANVPRFLQGPDGSIQVYNRPRETSAEGPAETIETYITVDGLEWIQKDEVKNCVDGESDAGFIDATLATLHKELEHAQTFERLQCVGIRKQAGLGQSRSETEYIEVVKSIKKGELILWAMPGAPQQKLKEYNAEIMALFPGKAYATYTVKDTCSTERITKYMVHSCWTELKYDPAVVGSRVYDGTERLHHYWKVRRVTPTMIENSRKKHEKDIPINMELGEHEFFYTLAAMMPGPVPKSISKTTVVTVPYLTNTTDLKEGDILAMRVHDPPEKKKAAPKKHTWDSQAKEKVNEQRKKQNPHYQPT